MRAPRLSPAPGQRRLALALALGLCLALASGASWAAAGEELLWFAAGRPSAQARQAIELLQAARSDGLDPADYQAEPLSLALAQVEQAPAGPALRPLDQALTQAMQRYLADLHQGRVDPRRIHADFSVTSPGRIDAPARLRTALAGNRLAEAVREAAPALPQYPRLRAALARYRELAEHPAWQASLPPLPGKALKPGQAWYGLPLLAQRLGALGDLPAGAPLPGRYEGALVDSVRAFQARHGLAQDGVLGPATLAQLNQPPAARARQIELSMERLRWTPLLQGPRMIVVNVPEFMLRAYEVREGRVEVRLAMKVIVGKALDTRTPLFDEAMRFIEFSPYWNVPPSIARGELVPRLRREPAYFEQQGFEFVAGDGSVIRTLSDAQLERVLRGQLRIRQRPGPANALGDIKFVFPNNDNIYLHHTPAPELFQRERRDFSHGCIRVEEPVALAKFVLQDAPDWPESRILEAMARGESATLRLKDPVPVVIAYSTTLVRQDGRVFFFPDLYGHDRLLDEALRARPRPAGPMAPQPGTP
ncbi:L,D-transpeptidase family protein [Ramlibacter sp. 2FC]|uniref:L,D-transpeptidase family protein n=1 Tax=Ramlibacter sp. 2FC TaxID=2502188 RepID=UPI0010F6DFB9|nr:L,D-transpeptidase family protein [Ramlibacter sp. 2FC]